MHKDTDRTDNEVVIKRSSFLNVLSIVVRSDPTEETMRLNRYVSICATVNDTQRRRGVNRRCTITLKIYFDEKIIVIIDKIFFVIFCNFIIYICLSLFAKFYNMPNRKI